MKSANHQNKGTKKGFTLVELSFAVLFISVLLLTVTLIINEIVSIYRKGYTMKMVNSVGRDLIDDFSDALSQTSSGNFADYCKYLYEDYRDENNQSTNAYKNCTEESPSGMRTIFQQYYTDIDVVGSTAVDKQYPYGGIICTGSYSYIYQTGYVMNRDLYTIPPKTASGISLSYTDSNGASQEAHDYTLLKLSDPSRALCRGNLDNDYRLKEEYVTIGDRQYRKITMSETLGDPDEPIELLSNSDVRLALFGASVAPPAQTDTTNKMLYSMSFILATISGGADIKRSTGYCTEPDLTSIDFSYCAINKFNFTIQANGGGRKR